MKKLVSLLAVMLVVVMAMGTIVACGKKDAKPSKKDDVVVDTDTEKDSEESSADEETEKETGHKFLNGGYAPNDLAVLVCDTNKSAEELEQLAKDAGHFNLNAMIHWLVEQNELFYVPAFTYEVPDSDGEKIDYEAGYTYKNSEKYVAALSRYYIDSEDAVSKEEYEFGYLAVLVNNRDYGKEDMEKIALEHGYASLENMINHLVDAGYLFYVPSYSYIDAHGNEVTIDAGYAIKGTGRYNDGVKMGVIRPVEINIEK